MHFLGYIFGSLAVIFLVAKFQSVLAWWRKFLRIRDFEKKVGGPPQLMFLGNIFEFGKSPEGLAQMFCFEWPGKFGPRYTFAFGNNHFFSSLKVEDVEQLLSSSVHITKGQDYDFARPWLGDGLVMSTGSKWSHRRKVLTPSFHFKILEEFLPIFNKHAKTFVRVNGERSSNGDFFDICRPVSLCTLDIICETAMGTYPDTQNNPSSPYVEAVHGMGELILDRYSKPWLHPDLLYRMTKAGQRHERYLKTLHGYTESVIKERRELIKESSSNSIVADNEEKNTFRKKRALAFLDMLLEVQNENPDAISDEGIREEVDVFMFEGHDTTAVNIQWTLFCLGNNPACQAKVQEELDSIFGSDKERDVTQDDICKLKYMECCIKEALRMYPSVPYIARELHEDLTLSDGLIVPKGVTCTLFTIPYHSNGDIFPEPKAFKPERFNLENASGRHPYAYVPFSAGPRNCIGQKFALMEEKVILAHLLRNFTCESLKKLGEIVPLTQVVLRPSGGIAMKFTRR